MRIFAAGLETETNTFAPWPTGRRAFEEAGLHYGEDALDRQRPDLMTARRWRELAERDGHDFTAGLFAIAQPSGPTVQSVYEGLRDDILALIAANGGFDVVLLFLHGAMVATGYDDCEADLVERVRALVGPQAAIGVELDPHCHLSQALVDGADAVVIMKHYPHDDYIPRGEELYRICLAKAQGRARPVSALFDCRMVGFYPTTLEPMATLVAGLKAAEREPGVLSVSLAHGFPWGDNPDTGTRVLAITDGDAAKAAALAERLGREIYAHREALLPRYASIPDALDAAAATPGLVVLGDTADNPGGGAPGDNPAMLRAMLARGCKDAVLGAIWDPVSAAAAADAGLGATLSLRLGGKCGAASGEPLDVQATVRAIREDHDQGGLGGSRSRLGLCVWLDVGGIDVVVSSIRAQVFAPDAFTGLGIDLASKRLAVVKSSQHFEGGFGPIAAKLIRVATPGAIQMDFAGMDYRKKRDLSFHPRVGDPLA